MEVNESERGSIPAGWRSWRKSQTRTLKIVFIFMRNWIFKEFFKNIAIMMTVPNTFIIITFTVHLTGLFLDLIAFFKHYQNNTLEIAKPYTC